MPLLPPPAPALLLPPPLRGRVGVGGPRVRLPPKSTNPTSTKCTARSPCPIARPARFRKNLSAAQARSSSPPTRATPVPSSAPPRAPPAAHRGNGVGGSGGRKPSDNRLSL